MYARPKTFAVVVANNTLRTTTSNSVHLKPHIIKIANTTPSQIEDTQTTHFARKRRCSVSWWYLLICSWRGALSTLFKDGAGALSSTLPQYCRLLRV